MGISAASSFWFSYSQGGNVALICGDGPNSAYSTTCYNSVGHPISSLPHTSLHFLFGICKRLAVMEAYQISVREADCNAFTTYMLTCKLWTLVSKSNTFWEAGCGTENGSTQSVWCAKHHTCTTFLLNTQLVLKLFKMHHVFKAHSIISIQSMLNHILEILLFLPQRKITW